MRKHCTFGQNVQVSGDKQIQRLEDYVLIIVLRYLINNNYLCERATHGTPWTTE